jgi:predicted DNA-binding transcriptional regulator AlpA
MPATEIDATYLTTPKMAAALGCTSATLLRWSATDPRFPQPSRVSSRKLLFDRAAVLSYIASLRRPPRAGEVKE